MKNLNDVSFLTGEDLLKVLNILFKTLKDCVLYVGNRSLISIITRTIFVLLKD